MKASELVEIGSAGGYIISMGESRLIPHTTSIYTLNEFEDEYDGLKFVRRNYSRYYHPDISTTPIAQWSFDNGLSDPETDWNRDSYNVFTRSSFNQVGGFESIESEPVKNKSWSYEKRGILGLASHTQTNTIAFYYQNASNGEQAMAVIDLKTGYFKTQKLHPFLLSHEAAPFRVTDFGAGVVEGWGFLNSAGSLSYISDDNPTVVNLTDFSGRVPDLPEVKDSPAIWQTGYGQSNGLNWITEDNGTEWVIYWKDGGPNETTTWNQVLIPNGCKEVLRVIPCREEDGYEDNFYIVYLDSSLKLRIAVMLDWADNDTRGFYDLTDDLPFGNISISTANNPIQVSTRPSGHCYTEDYLYISFCTQMFQSHRDDDPSVTLTDWTEYSHPAIVRVPRQNHSTVPTEIFEVSASRWELSKNGPYINGSNVEGDNAPRREVTISVANVDCKIYGGGKYVGVSIDNPFTSRNITRYVSGYTPIDEQYTDGFYDDDYSRMDVIGKIQLDHYKTLYLNGVTNPSNFDIIIDDILNGNTPTVEDAGRYRNSNIFPIAPNLLSAFKDHNQDMFGPRKLEFHQVISDSKCNVAVGAMSSLPDSTIYGTLFYSGDLGSDGKTVIFEEMTQIPHIGSFFTRVE